MADRILIIEDEEPVAEVIALNLELEGFSTDLALNGTTGLASARGGGYDLIICDIMLPDIDGYDICRQLKADRRTSAVPVILLTARVEVENKLAGLEAGADDFITKPFEFTELLTRINMNLDRAAMRYRIDPVTGLAGNITADDALRERVLEGAPLGLLLMRVNGLKPYREVYGDDKFEQVIRFVSDTIKDVIAKQGGPGDLATYLGGGSFSVLTVPERTETFCRYLVLLFDKGMGRFYGAGDLDRRGILTFDRRGGIVDNPIMTVSVGAVTNARRRIGSHWEAAEIAREVLDHAMTFPGSSYFIDRRTNNKKKSE